MPAVAELSAPYANLMLGPRRGPDVCDVCFNLTAGFHRCYACARGQQWLDAFVPISYSVGGEQLHHALSGYKRLDGEAARRLRVELAAVLWRFLLRHESCVLAACGAQAFSLVTTVPSGDLLRDACHPLREIAGELVGATRCRYRRVLCRSAACVVARRFSAERFVCRERLDGASVLLIDDTWTSGASAQSAAAALKLAGARRVAAVVIGRFVNREWGENDRRLRGIDGPFDWERCALCPEPVSAPAAPRTRSRASAGW